MGSFLDFKSSQSFARDLGNVLPVLHRVRFEGYLTFGSGYLGFWNLEFLEDFLGILEEFNSSPSFTEHVSNVLPVLHSIGLFVGYLTFGSG